VKRLAIANWKLNLPPEGISAYADAMSGIDGVVVAPPFPYVRELAAKLVTGGQNCSEHASGAFTGEVAASMLRDCGARYVIVGHSERRTIYGESDAVIGRKLSAALDAGLTPVFCIGENQQVRDSGQAATHVADQIDAVAPHVRADADLVVAYEPIWAIGTGRNATGEMVADMVRVIRNAVQRLWPATAATAPILYGGSVTPDNIDDLGTNGRIAGYLVGGASLDSTKFKVICAGLDRLRPA
jgi:triosephosphate isomerase